MRWMRTTTAAVIFGLLALTVAATAPAAAAEHRFGLGGHYWRAIDDLDASDLDIDEDGIAPYFTYQFVPAGIFKLELDLEYHADGFGGGTDTAYSPVGFVLVEFGLYAGLGIGVTVSDSLPDNVSDPFYAARLGWDFQVLPRLHVDLNANYRGNTFSALEDYDSDTITLGAALRVALGSRD
jgi:hypothetical protein